MAKKKITEIVEEVLKDFLTENGYELYSTEFVKEGRDWFLRIFADLSRDRDEEGNPVYIGTEDCEKISRYLSAILDELDPIEQNYYLEVSSPGMDRPLVKPEHYAKYVGRDVEIRLYRGIDGTKNIEGVLAAFAPEEGRVCIKDYDGKEWILKTDEIAKANLAVIF